MYSNELKTIINAILFSSMVFFSTTNIFVFIFFYEIILIPILIIIWGWGYQYERIQAIIYLLLYISNFSLISYFFLFLNLRKNSFSSIYDIIFIYTRNSRSFIALLLFLVKIPIFSLHLWLPKAHVEAPTIGSIQLAGVLLKLGGYGIKRFITLFKTNSNNNIFVILLFFLLTLAVVTIFQRDNKKFIAYISITHINFLLFFIFISTDKGSEVLSLISLSHGICSSSLFFIVGNIYIVSKTRILYFFQRGCLFYIFDIINFISRNIRNLRTPPFLARFVELRIFSYILSYDNSRNLLLLFFFFLNTFSAIYFILRNKFGKKKLILKSNITFLSRAEIIIFAFNFFFINSGF